MNSTGTEFYKKLLSEFITNKNIPDSLRNSFKDINITGRNHSGLEYFINKDLITNTTCFNTNGTLVEWTEISGNIGKGKININNMIIEKNVYVKTIHLLDPFSLLQHKYTCEEDKLNKLNRKNNQAYIDCITSSILSNLRSNNITRHALESYGYICGVKKVYKYNITDDYASLRNKKWFWDEIGICGEKLIIQTNEDNIQTIVDKFKTAPTTFLESDNNSISSLKSSFSFKSFTNDINDTNTKVYDNSNTTDIDNTFIELDNLDILSTRSDKTLCIQQSNNLSIISNDEDTNEFEEIINSYDIELFIEFYDMPVILLFQEAADGTFSDLIDEEYNKEYEIYDKYGYIDDDEISSDNNTMELESDNSESDSESCSQSDSESDSESCSQSDSESCSQSDSESDKKTVDLESNSNKSDISEDEEYCEELLAELAGLYIERDEKLSAWIFQIIAALVQFQNLIQLCHNDLHTNNIMWKNTKEEYLYYKSRNGKIWKVPTYGKIFYIIDFGRATFTLSGVDYYSDDYLEDGDAFGQYNYADMYNNELPEVKPNYSFDLCRLSTSIVDDLFIETPTNKNDKILYKEGSWEKNETISDIYNILWKWLIDKDGKNVLINKDYVERFSGFDLYIKIASDCNKSNPKDQLYISPFNNFIIKNKKPIHNYQLLYI
jgi:hypothetical protein